MRGYITKSFCESITSEQGSQPPTGKLARSPQFTGEKDFN